MRARIQKWGNSLAVRIPKSFAVDAQMKQDAVVDLSVVNGRIIVQLSAEKPRYELDQLLSDTGEDRLHPETDWGTPVGSETL
jgi:antitoxin MazE